MSASVPSLKGQPKGDGLILAAVSGLSNRAVPVAVKAATRRLGSVQLLQFGRRQMQRGGRDVVLEMRAL
jgi:hypothetical protein